MLESLPGTFDGAEIVDDLVAFRGPAEDHAQGKPGLAVDILEGDLGVKFGAGDVVVTEPIRFHDFGEDAMVFIVGAVRAVHDESPGSTGFYIHLVNGVGEAVGTPPLRQVLWFGPRFPDELARSIEDAGGDYFAVGGVG